MSPQTIQVSLSRSNLEAQIAALLYATGKIQDDEEVLNMSFSKSILNGDDLITIGVTKQKEGRVIRHNGTN